MAATFSFCRLASMSMKSMDNTTKKKLGWLTPSNAPNPRRSLSFKSSLQAPTYINNDSFRINDVSLGPLVTNQLSNLSLFFGEAVSRIFVENSNIRTTCIFEEFGISGKFVDNGLVFCQDFSIRSYEVGADGTISLETLISHLQETGLNHLKVTGLLGDGLGSMPEMYKRKLFWVATKTQIMVDHYPTWGDTIQVENWLVLSKKNSLRRESVVRDTKTGNILVRASSNFVMMNKETRRLCRFPDEVREEMSLFCKDAPSSFEDDCRKIPMLDDTTSDYMCEGLKARWSDLDINQHVNNAKYIGWILESAPVSAMKSHKVSRITLEYKRECQRDNLLQSMTMVSSDNVAHLSHPDGVECYHLLKLEGGAEIMKARTEWVPK